MTTAPTLCRRCRDRVSVRRGLCWHCQRSRKVRPLSPAALTGHGKVETPPHIVERIAAYQKRAALRLPLFEGVTR